MASLWLAYSLSSMLDCEALPCIYRLRSPHPSLLSGGRCGYRWLGIVDPVLLPPELCSCFCDTLQVMLDFDWVLQL